VVRDVYNLVVRYSVSQKYAVSFFRAEDGRSRILQNVKVLNYVQKIVSNSGVFVIDEKRKSDFRQRKPF
jgi:hypothetical protein